MRVTETRIAGQSIESSTRLQTLRAGDYVSSISKARTESSDQTIPVKQYPFHARLGLYWARDN